MKNDDYGFYGKGLDGYVHYRQGMQEAARSAETGRRPPDAFGALRAASCMPCR